MARRRAAPPLLILTGLAFALCTFGLTGQSLWRDEVDTLRFASGPLMNLLRMFRDPGQNGPLFFLMLRPWLAATGASEFALRFPAAAAAALAVPILSVLVWRLTGNRIAAHCAALLLATAPLAVWYGQEAKMYAALTVLAPASLLATLTAARRGGWWRWLLLYVTTTLSFYTHLLAVLIVPVQFLWLLLLPGNPQRRLRRPIVAAAYLAALVAPYLPLFWWQADMWRAAGWDTGHPAVAFGDLWAALLGGLRRGVLQIEQVWTLLPYLLALIEGVLLGLVFQAGRGATADKNRPGSGDSAIYLLLVWLLLPPLAVYVISLRVPVFTVRYLIWTLPAFAALTSLGTVALARVWRPLGLATLAALLALNTVSLGAQTARPIKSDFRAAARFVLEHRRSDDLLIYQIPYIRYTFAYYASAGHDPEDPAFRGLDGLYTNAGMSETEAETRMTLGAAGAHAAWLIASETAMWDERGLTESWLAAHGTPGDHADFERVSVTRYELQK